MKDQLVVRCIENQNLAQYLRTRTKEIVDNPEKEVSERLLSTLALAYRNICEAETPINSLKDLSRIRGVGKWIIRLMHGAFQGDKESLLPQKAAKIGKKPGAPKRYIPQKNSAAYALLITLYRGISKGNEFMKKQELIDETEASGLARTSIGHHGERGKPKLYGNSMKDWYTGWNCMKTLIDRGLVVKSSCPAKYMLTDEGKETASECLARSGLESSDEVRASLRLTEHTEYGCQQSESEISCTVSFSRNLTLTSDDTSSGKETSSDQEDCNFMNWEDKHFDTSDSYSHNSKELHTEKYSDFPHPSVPCRPFTLKACSKEVTQRERDEQMDIGNCIDGFAMPPIKAGQRFEEEYDVILLLDDRENFGSKFSKVVDAIRVQFKIHVEVRRLPIGDGIWIARHRKFSNEYVLDFIVERKQINDLCSSIRDNRYKDQKLRLLRCGVRKLIYLIEGDPNSSEAAERIKTACFTTEILEGFDVQRTSGISDTVKKYGYLTQSIIHLYKSQLGAVNQGDENLCPTFESFVKRCQDHEKLCISDIFSLQLMQVPQVTEQIALTVVKEYPTLHSLACAYAALDCDVRAQEEMLKVKGLTSSAASRNIFRFVWES
ncbi:restriction endonuclease, type II-like superfamily protein [Wolffia australiana]